jgi:hypothetical protein
MIDRTYGHFARDGEAPIRVKVRQSLASIGFGQRSVDQPLTNEPSE